MAVYIVLDTNIFAYLVKGDSRADLYRPHLVDQILCLSFQTVAELYLWAELRNWGTYRRVLLEHRITACVVLPYDHETARLWGTIRAQRQRAGRPISAEDAWIAASALRHELPLATHNPSDFAGIEGLHVITEANR